MAKTIGLGIDDFKMIIEGNYAFVDKTLFINEFFQSGAHVTLTPRPRRFGKTMNLSMLKYFCEKTENSNSHLFDGLKVSQYPEIMAHQGQYPVIFLTFKDVKVSTWEGCYKKLCNVITAEFERHKYLLSSIESEYEQKNFTAILNGEASQEIFEDSLKNLSKYLCEYHNKRVIILIDEYDTPVHESAARDRDKKPEEKTYLPNVLGFFRNFMCAGLKGNTSLHKGFITGILQVAKESIFSGMNNLSVCTFADIGVAEIIKEDIARKMSQGFTEQEAKKNRPNNILFTNKFGLLEEEVVDLFAQAQAPLDLAKIKHWYNGYRSGVDMVYNPWSIVSFLTNKLYEPHWINTSDNKLPRTIVARASAEIKAEIEQLREGGIIRKKINKSISFVDIEAQENVIWSFLLFCGYLTFQAPEIQEDASDFYLVVPNQEVKDFFKTMVTAWFDIKPLQKILSPLLLSLVSGNIQHFKEHFEDTVMRCFSYLDIGENEAESFYHAFVLGIISGLDKTHIIRSNREAGTGRYDIMIVPRDVKDIGILIEFKKCLARGEETLEVAAINALEQIEEKKYETELREYGVTNIKKLAIVFDGKTSLVKEG